MRLHGLLFALLAAGAALGCSRAERERPAPVEVCPETAEKVVDPALLAFLGRARSAHHLADLAEEKGDLAEALRVLQAFLAGKAPRERAEAEEVLADTHARVADLQSQLGEFDKAQASVQKGMRFAKGTTYYLGHLWEMQGVVAERRAKRLRSDGSEEAARRAEKHAIEAFERSMQIQEKVLDQLVKAKKNGAPEPSASAPAGPAAASAVPADRPLEPNAGAPLHPNDAASSAPPKHDAPAP